MVLMSRIIAESTNEVRRDFNKHSLGCFHSDRHQDGDILSRFTSDLDNILKLLTKKATMSVMIILPFILVC